MRRLPRFGWLIALIGVNMVSPTQAESLTAVPFQDVKITDGFWSKRIHINRTATIEANLHQCESTGRIRNFAIAGKLEKGEHKGLLYDDSDLYKVLEGIAYTLSNQRDADLEKRTDAIIDKIAAAQQADGYLNTYYTLVKPTERWKNLQNGHELYCAGHLIETAAAYHQATGKRKLLDVAIRLADHIDHTFGPGKKVDTSGHEEIELALVKLYRATRQERYLKLAQFFLDARGRKDDRRLFGAYAQDDKPIREQKEVAGHAVRAMYLYCGMADVAGLTGDKALIDALTTIWHDVVERKMYVTGGIGPSASNEGFTVPYDLPNDSAYAETCAAIGMALWNHRMFLLSGDGAYADVLEREVYNGLLSGVSLSGDRFFYTNPLGSVSQHHRVPWFDCSCCPTNIVRYIPGMGERVWAHRDNAVWSVLYMGNTATVSLKDGKVRLIEKTNYPWEGDIEIAVEPDKLLAFEVLLRIPGWCRVKPVVTVNGAKMAVVVEHGYVRLRRTWKKGDVIRLLLPMLAERVHADPRVQADRGRVALQRGPLLYCLEGVDNGGKVRNLCLPKEAKLSAKRDKNLLGGVVVLRGKALAVSRPDEKLEIKKIAFKAVPYFAWDNRQSGQMIVWIAEEPERAELPPEDGVIVEGVRIRASYLNPADTLDTLTEGSLPKASKDQSIRRITWWDHRGSVEWLSYRTSEPRKLSSASVYWFDDT
ncbi:MAG: glycoside hydrolase family 127 protein, partial [Gemmataceae bacterium]